MNIMSTATSDIIYASNKGETTQKLSHYNDSKT